MEKDRKKYCPIFQHALIPMHINNEIDIGTFNVWATCAENLCMLYDDKDDSCKLGRK